MVRTHIQSDHPEGMMEFVRDRETGAILRIADHGVFTRLDEGAHDRDHVNLALWGDYAEDEQQAIRDEMARRYPHATTEVQFHGSSGS